MSKLLLSSLIRTALLTLAPMVMVVSSAQGQSLAAKIKVTIPFDFIVGDKKLPAGEYLIGRAQPSSGDSLVALSSRNRLTNISSSTFEVDTLKPNTQGKVVFHCYGDQCFLFQIWPVGSNTGREIARSRRERDVERKAQIAEGTIGERSIVIHLP